MSRLLFSAVLGFGIATSGMALAQTSASTSVDSGINASGTTKQQTPDSSTTPDNSAVNGTMASNAGGTMMNNNAKGTPNSGAASAQIGSGSGGAGAGGGSASK